MAYYLAYGSNVNSEQLRFRCPSAVWIANTVIPDHKLVFWGELPRHGVANIVRAKGASVPAVLWELSEQDVERLDRYEVKYYRELLMVSSGSKPISAFVYRMRAGKPALPDPLYFRIIVRGYREQGWDTDPLHQARQDAMNGQDDAI